MLSTKGNACDPQNYEPNLALNLEVADLINSKKGNASVPPPPGTPRAVAQVAQC